MMNNSNHIKEQIIMYIEPFNKITDVYKQFISTKYYILS